jgi:uncharacterized protein (DUF427 family)
MPVDPHPHEFEPSPRRVRALLGHVPVADSRRVMLLREAGRVPVYYFPEADVRTDLLAPSGPPRPHPRFGEAAIFDVAAGGRTAPQAAWAYRESPAGAPGLAGHVAFEWSQLDAWFEEDEEVFVHARDPYKRVDVCHGSRHVRVVVGGETVAETRRPRLLFETGLPTRYYIPKADVRMDLLVPTDTHTRCPYKGIASYYAVKAGDALVRDLVWTYPSPIPECAKIEDLLCFFNEKVDTWVDGVLEPRPVTRWS